jgi:hypothetical protein
MRRGTAIFVAWALACACGDFKSTSPAPASDGDGERDAAAAGNADAGSGSGDGESAAQDARPSESGGGDGCRPAVVPCLDPASAKVVEVPSEATAADAFANAKAGDTIQLNAASLGAGFRVPPYVTLHGCGGAKITSAIGFAGGAGTIEGFDVANGAIVANATGSYVVRWNEFRGSDQSPAVSGRSIDGLVSASVTLLVDGNLFTERPFGVVGDTNYDTGTHEVTLTVQNNVFANVARPVLVTEGGLVGKVTAKVAFNTFYGFTTAIGLFDATPQALTIGNLFVHGDTAVDATSVYTVDYSLAWQVTNTTRETPPLSGAIATGDPALVDAAGRDFRLGKASSAIDLVPAATQVPSPDYFGCPRPRAYAGADPKADIGAIEAQP